MKEFKIAVMPGDGIGKEITEPSVNLITETAKSFGVKLNNVLVDAGAELYARTGDAFPEENFEEANIFNDYFCQQSQVDDDNIDLPVNYDNNDPYCNLDNIIISVQDVKDNLQILNTNKATGPDNLNPMLLKQASSELAYPLTKLFNLSLQSSTVPNQWKIANVTPVYKKGSANTVSNYRPISLLSVLGKCMERCIFKYLYNFLHSNNILTPSQSGFRPNDSTVNQLLSISSDFYRAIDQGKEIRVVFFDISKAFDKVWHKGLLHKLSNLGIRGNLLKWFHSYLHNRKQCVVINGTKSYLKNVQAGVPQGSILGPLLFLIYINDLVVNIDCNIKLFADDTSIYITVENPFSSAALLNSDLEKINDWSKKWLVSFNPSKTECMTISNKIKKPFHPSLIFDDVHLKEVESHKHLGVIFSSNLSWNQHIDEMISKAYARLGQMRKVKFLLDRNCLQKIYFSFIRPALEYADIIWDNLPEYLSRKIENIQLEAARIVTGGNRMASIAFLYRETGWVLLSKRRENHRLVQFFKMFHCKTPEYLSNILEIQTSKDGTHNTRSNNSIREIFARTKLYYESFFPSTIRLWNTLPNEIQNNPSLNNFKKYLNRSNINIPDYYNFGSRKGQILHSQLRLECSALKLYMFRRNLCPSPLCTCGSIESNDHYLLYCPNYNVIRSETINKLRDSTNVNLLLFGSPNLSDNDNKYIFYMVQKFIIDSKRFQGT